MLTLPVLGENARQSGRGMLPMASTVVLFLRFTGLRVLLSGISDGKDGQVPNKGFTQGPWQTLQPAQRRSWLVSVVSHLDLRSGPNHVGTKSRTPRNRGGKESRAILLRCLASWDICDPSIGTYSTLDGLLKGASPRGKSTPR